MASSQSSGRRLCCVVGIVSKTISTIPIGAAVVVEVHSYDFLAVVTKMSHLVVFFLINLDPGHL